VYYLATAVYVAQPFLHEVNTPHYIWQPSLTPYALKESAELFNVTSQAALPILGNSRRPSSVLTLQLAEEILGNHKKGRALDGRSSTCKKLCEYCGRMRRYERRTVQQQMV
jgi:hypothetical protein